MPEAAPITWRDGASLRSNGAYGPRQWKRQRVGARASGHGDLLTFIAQTPYTPTTRSLKTRPSPHPAIPMPPPVHVQVYRATAGESDSSPEAVEAKAQLQKHFVADGTSSPATVIDVDEQSETFAAIVEDGLEAIEFRFKRQDVDPEHWGGIRSGKRMTVIFGTASSDPQFKVVPDERQAPQIEDVKVDPAAARRVLRRHLAS